MLPCFFHGFFHGFCMKTLICSDFGKLLPRWMTTEDPIGESGRENDRLKTMGLRGASSVETKKNMCNAAMMMECSATWKPGLNIESVHFGPKNCDFYDDSDFRSQQSARQNITLSMMSYGYPHVYHAICFGVGASRRPKINFHYQLLLRCQTRIHCY